MGKYLLYISYIGSGFNGIQAQSNVIRGKKIETVQKVLEEAVSVLRPAVVSRVRCSSRTDSGVHALMSTAYVDLKHSQPEVVYCPKVVAGVMNEYLDRRQIPVRVIKARQVSVDLHSLSAKSRTYIYRMVVAKDIWRWNIPLPLWELENCWRVPQPMDMDKVQEAVSVFNGTHNFYAFSNKGGEKRDPVRTLSLGIQRSQGILGEHYTPHLNDNLQFWTLTFKSSGFLYRQVRRITGALYKVGIGKMTKEDIVHLLHNPYDVKLANHFALAAPPQGLFLKEVEYDENELIVKEGDGATVDELQKIML